MDSIPSFLNVAHIKIKKKKRSEYFSMLMSLLGILSITIFVNDFTDYNSHSKIWKKIDIIHRRVLELNS